MRQNFVLAVNFNFSDKQKASLVYYCWTIIKLIRVYIWSEINFILKNIQTP